MKQTLLDNLQIGEKIVDIQEHFYGTNGKHLVYKVTIYSCIKFLFGFKRIKKYTFPFYFASKEFAESFLQHYDSFEIYDKWYYDMWGQPDYFGLSIKLLNSKHDKYQYRMVDNLKIYGDKCDVLREDGVWGGLVNYYLAEKRYKPLWSSKYNIFYLDIQNKEELAAKEGTDGKTFSYKLQKI